jgi:plastocyanin
MTRATLAGLLASALLLAGCGDSDPSPPTQDDLADLDLSPDHTITVDEDGYSPAELEIAPGEVVLLVNEGSEPHSFTADDQAFDTGRMQPGDETTLVLTEPDDHPYRDLGDPDRTGTLTVRDEG